MGKFLPGCMSHMTAHRPLIPNILGRRSKGKRKEESFQLSSTNGCQVMCQNFLQIFPVVMYQSIPAVNMPRATPGDSHILLRSPRGFTYKFGFRRGQIFPEMNENLLNIFIFRGCFEEAIQNGRKTLVFV